MTDKISVNCQAKLTEAITCLTTMYRDKKFVVVSLRPGKDRTLDQNRLWFGMYKRIAEMTQIGDAADARRYCKLHFITTGTRTAKSFRWEAISIKPDSNGQNLSPRQSRQT